MVDTVTLKADNSESLSSKPLRESNDLRTATEAVNGQPLARIVPHKRPCFSTQENRDLNMQSLFQDVRDGFRQLVKMPGFTLTAVISLYPAAPQAK